MSAGKGDTPRSVIGPKYRANFDLIFPENKPCSSQKVWDVCPQTATDDHTPPTPVVHADGHET